MWILVTALHRDSRLAPVRLVSTSLAAHRVLRVEDESSKELEDWALAAGALAVVQVRDAADGAIGWLPVKETAAQVHQALVEVTVKP